MKLKTFLSATLFAAIAALSISAQAASDMDKAAEAKTPAADMQADKAVPKKMKPHSHVQEKTGVPQDAPADAAPGKKDASKDKTKHYHPRDK